MKKSSMYHQHTFQYFVLLFLFFFMLYSARQADAPHSYPDDSWATREAAGEDSSISDR